MATLTKTLHDWQSLVELSGLLISEPVLNDKFPNGTPALPIWLSRQFRKEYERWQSAEDKRSEKPDSADEALKRWQKFILTELLEYGNRLGNVLDMPPQLKVELSDYMQTLKPDNFVLDEQGNPQLLVYFAEKGLDRPESKTGQWKASPFTKLDRLLRETKVQLGILTNGEEWRLVYAAPGLPSAYITWTAGGWKDEIQTLQAWRMLLLDPAKLQEMASESQSRQADVTDKLGNQVLSALSIFVRQLDKADAETNGALLADLSPQDVYEMALFVMMRLVFMFYAEENTLLPHGDPIFDDAYGLTRLWNTLDRQRFEDESLLKQREDAFPALLASFRLIHAGCNHPDLKMVAYGGALFDPERFPVLEDPRLIIKNDAIWRILRRLTTAETDGQRQRVSYRSLQVEQLGYVYENLLGYTVKEANETMILPFAALEAVSLKSYIDALGDGDEKRFYEYYKDLTTGHWSQAKKIASEVSERYKTGSDDVNWVFEPSIEERIETGQRYLAYEMGTRKRGGIFYTPPQLTSFLVEQALKPQVYENPEEETGIRSAEHILALTVCDPAMGSGAFLVQAVRYLADRLLESWDAAQTRATGETKLVMPYAQAEAVSRESYGIIPTERAEALAWARRLVAERCIYGVDLNHLAVELAKLSIWLVTLSKDKPFTFLDHRLRHGNSLIGASFFKETTLEVKKRRKGDYEEIGIETRVRQLEFIPDEALQPYKDASSDYKGKARNNLSANKKAQDAIASGQMSLFGNLSVEEALKRLIKNKTALEAPTKAAHDYDSKAQLLRDVLGQGDYPILKEIADLWCAVWFWERDIAKAGMPPTTQEYHDVVQTILGTVQLDIFGESKLATAAKRLEQIREVAKRIAKNESFYHWELEYPQIFTRQNAGFDAMVGNPPWETIEPNSQEFFEVYDAKFRDYGKQEAILVIDKLTKNNPNIANHWHSYASRIESQAIYGSANYNYQGRGKAYTYKLFAENIWSSLRDHAYASLMMPSGIYTDLGAMEIREVFLNQGRITYLFSFSNERFIFPNVDHRFKFVMLGLQKGKPGVEFPASFRLDPRVSISAEDIPDFLANKANYIQIPHKAIRQFSPDSFSIMEFKSQADLNATKIIYSTHPLLGHDIKNIWNVRFTQEINMTSDSHLFNENDQGIALYEGKMIHQFDSEFGKPRYWLNERDAFKAVGEREYYKAARIGIRLIARSTDERTMISTVVPPRVFCGHSMCVEVGEILRGREKLYLTSMLNSFSIDFVMRQKVSANISMFYLYQLPIPRLQTGNPYFDALVPRAAKLTCTTHHFAELWEEVMGSEWDETVGAKDEKTRQQIRNEIDALVAHLYGLSREDFEHILHTFPLVFPPVVEIGKSRIGTLEEGGDGHVLGSREAGKMNPKMFKLLQEYDKWADVVKDWSRE